MGLITHIATAGIAVTAALVVATVATAVYGASETALFLWAATAALITRVTVTVTHDVTAWRRAYQLGRQHAGVDVALVRQPAKAHLQK